MQNYTKYIIGLVVILIIGVLVYSMSGNGKATEKMNEMNEMTEKNSAENIPQTQNTNINENKTEENKKMKATYNVKMETNKGVIELQLNTNIAPKTVENFLKLANEGFYNNVKFHRVIKDFMIQAGDPLSKDDKMMSAWGTGGPGYKFEDEITDAETYKAGYIRGVLAMANSGPNTNGSQFFIMHKDVPLPPNYTIFGNVISGLEVVDAIANVKTGNNDRPEQPVIIKSVSVIE